MAHENRVALVTGASKGVGKGIALGLARSGWDVVVNYHRDAEGARQTINEIETLGRQAWVAQGDVGQEADVERMFAELDGAIGRIDLLVNNAGVQTWCPLLELSLADFERTIRTNLIGAFLCTQAAARRMRSSGGAIVNIGSGANRTPFPNLADYCASKGGLETLTKVAAVELGEHQIRVNCVAPGAIEIERTRQESPDYAATWAAVTPLGRVGQVDDVAAAVVFLADSSAAFVTGQTLYVDGGLWTRGVWPYD